MRFIQLAFPLPMDQEFTYSVPQNLYDEVAIGKRAVAPFGQRMLTGFIVEITSEPPFEDLSKIKRIIKVLDENPVFDPERLPFFRWLASFYISSLGEALKLTDPYGTAVQSQKFIYSDHATIEKFISLEKNQKTSRYRVMQLFLQKDRYLLKQLQNLTGVKSILNTLKKMEQEGIVTIGEGLSSPRVRSKTERFVKLIKPLDEVYAAIPEIERRSPKQVTILLKLASFKTKEAPTGKLLKVVSGSDSSLKGLQDKGLVEIYDKNVERLYRETYTEELKSFQLTEAQVKVIDSVSPYIKKREFKPFLLHGVTGSGKTQVYIELIKQVLKKGESVLLLVPEISLTPQMTARLTKNFGDKVAVIHSRVSPGERHDAWMRIAAGKCSVVTGARSALFAPVKNLGLIVIDEEHDASYKQEEIPPKYHARDAAVMLAKQMNCPVLMGSATPSIESMFNAQKGKYTLLQLPERVDGATLPTITLVNTTEMKKKGEMENVFAKSLLTKIDERIKKGEGVILLQNRRGFATQVYCVECGQIEKCDNCSVGMVYHIKSNNIKCHYCNLVKPMPLACSRCGSKHLKLFGTGTERVEDELAFYFPEARIQRVDSDTIGEKGKLGETLNKFRDGEIDILIGTQMVAKGLDFPRVTLVGVISAEASLWMPDFRAEERTFQLLTQVSGRAGRSVVPGEVVIQTFDSNNPLLQFVLNNDYLGFYNRDLQSRQFRLYPPFANLCLAETRDKDARKASDALIDLYKEMFRLNRSVAVLPPTTAVLAKLKNEFRFQMLIKTDKKFDPAASALRETISKAYNIVKKSGKHRDIRIVFDMNPYSIV
ncbi:MAG: primosomal protein N' [Ignavibacteriales bacterium]|nr:MAG: primosomal protein N' [Ignavibacteriaceae bacterium]MBW7872689.1 primosomal protein N' [Ignavibacteria bacterium]MCZ2143410.1 primosomal protein N' [Ignavibacteriales bacterium]OQY74077.1 MAG: primosomal protein N' [Ignavibacteriales bacterium UTCHB3]MBV6444289.1 primosomal protein N' [Ignavibacteriaceae bacterium]